MAYKLFVAGEEALASDANSFLMSQTVPRFTNATQRTSQLTAPVVNQLSMRDDRPGAIERWNGTAWVTAGPVTIPFGLNPNVPMQEAATTTYAWNLTLPIAGTVILNGIAGYIGRAGVGDNSSLVTLVTASGGPVPQIAVQFSHSGMMQPGYRLDIPFFTNYTYQPAGTLALALATQIAGSVSNTTLINLVGTVTVQP